MSEKLELVQRLTLASDECDILSYMGLVRVSLTPTNQLHLVFHHSVAFATIYNKYRTHPLFSLQEEQSLLKDAMSSCFFF